MEHDPNIYPEYQQWYSLDNDDLYQLYTELFKNTNGFTRRVTTWTSFDFNIDDLNWFVEMYLNQIEEEETDVSFESFVEIYSYFYEYWECRTNI